MKLIIADKEQDVEQVTTSQFKKLLKDGGYRKNAFAYGKSGIGKSAIVDEYGEENGLTVIPFSLATEMPEAIGGIPHAVGNTLEYFKRLLDERLAPLFKTKGKGYVLFFDEMNQAQPEVLNACYSICHPDPKKRHWNGHSLEYAQIIGAGNLSTGEDGTVYLTDIPTPLHNRFHIFEVIANNSDTKKYLADKWKNIPQVSMYIDALLDENIPPRDIDDVLEVLAYKMDSLWMSSKIGEPLTAKLLAMQKKIKTIDPAKTFKVCKESYKLFKEDGIILWDGKKINTEEQLIEKFKNILSEEEIEAIVKGDK